VQLGEKGGERYIIEVKGRQGAKRGTRGGIYSWRGKRGVIFSKWLRGWIDVTD